MEDGDDLLFSNRGVQPTIDDESRMVIYDDKRVESRSTQKKWSFDVDLPEVIWFPAAEIFPVSFILLVGRVISSMSPQNRVYGLSTDSYWTPFVSSDGPEKMVDIPWWMVKIQSNPMSPPIERIAKDNNSVLNLLCDFLLDSMGSSGATPITIYSSVVCLFSPFPYDPAADSKDSSDVFDAVFFFVKFNYTFAYFWCK
jgi:hypothetical protein